MVSLSTADEAPKQKTAPKSDKLKHLDGTNAEANDVPGDGCLEAIAAERREKERFLFEESNKINRLVIKFILQHIYGSPPPECLGGKQNSERKSKPHVSKPQPEAPTYAQAAAM